MNNLEKKKFLIQMKKNIRLVELSHQKDCWKKKFNIDEKFHNQLMDKDEIINEFAREI